MKHVLDHLQSNAKKVTHTVFKCERNQIVDLLDEAWKKKSSYSVGKKGNWNYNINMGKVIGTQGETNILIIVKPGGSELITGFPVK